MRAVIGKAPHLACYRPYKANGACWQRDAAWVAPFGSKKIDRAVKRGASSCAHGCGRRGDQDTYRAGAQRPAGRAMAAH